MRISVKQLRRIIKEAVVGELGPETGSILMSLRKATPGESPLEDYVLEDMGLAGVVHMRGDFRSPKAPDADPVFSARWNRQNYVYKVPAHLVDAFLDEFPDAGNAEDSFVREVSMDPRSPRARRMF